MKVLKSSKALRRVLGGLQDKGKRIGFVPTMGCLHEGHLSIVRRAKQENDSVVVSIFINPLQFGPKEDYARYPRNILGDKKLLAAEKTDFLYLPDPNNFYKTDFQTCVSLHKLALPLCGAARPTHFSGVCTAVLKLLNSVTPDVLYLGQKDYQQFCVIKQMILDLDIPVRVKMVPVMREPDGLAMSSRNVFLSLAERQEALLLHRSLQTARQCIKAGQRDTDKIKKAMREKLSSMRHGRIDYIEIVDSETLDSVIELTERSEILAAVAVFFNKARLIDNFLIKV